MPWGQMTTATHLIWLPVCKEFYTWFFTSMASTLSPSKCWTLEVGKLAAVPYWGEGAWLCVLVLELIMALYHLHPGAPHYILFTEAVILWLHPGSMGRLSCVESLHSRGAVMSGELHSHPFHGGPNSCQLIRHEIDVGTSRGVVCVRYGV